jgi:DNA-binding protein YbaB
MLDACDEEAAMLTGPIRIDHAAIAAKIRRLRADLATVEATADSPDDLVRATVDGRGRLLSLELSSRIYRELSSESLSDSIVDTVRAAARLATDQVMALNRPTPL